MTAHPEQRVTFLGYTTLVSLIRTAAVNLQNVFPPDMIVIIRTNRSTSSCLPSGDGLRCAASECPGDIF
jgi:hypothetical protein